MMKRTYTNKTPETRELVEVIRPGHKYDGPLHTYPVASLASITLSAIPGIRRRWRKD